ncbi:MAG: efflux RND transporter permease subunit, partial [Candidatus Zixiibacteriota bacterium]
MTHKSDQTIIQTTHNTARFFTEHRHVAWVALVLTVLWGIFGYFGMPQRKDPDIPVRAALAMCYWPGVGTEKIERLVTQRIEETIAENIWVKRIESTTRVGLAFAVVLLDEGAEDVGKEFDDIKMRLDGIKDLPEGAGPIVFIKDFGTTAALMLTVASPPASELETELRAKSVRGAIEAAREGLPADEAQRRLALVYCYPPSVSPAGITAMFTQFADKARDDGMLTNQRLIEGAGFIGMDATPRGDADSVQAYGENYVETHLRRAEFHPDVWAPALITDPSQTLDVLKKVAGDRYTYRQLDDFTDLIRRTLQTVPEVSKVDRVGVLEERIYLAYSQERLASYGVSPAQLQRVISARNSPLPGGMLEVSGRNVTIAPTGEFTGEQEIGDVIVGASASGLPLYLRDVVDIDRSYDSPPKYLNSYTRRGPDGQWQRTRAITLSVQMRPGRNIGEFGRAVDEALAGVKSRLPEDLVYARTSDQPLQVEENIHLFLSSLYEAIILVVLVSLIGFWEWRSAVLMSLSIPLTLAMTYGMMYMVGIDLQQISIASLIIALGLLVDDPVVAGDAIKRELSTGHKSVIAAWLGPTKLATAIMYATVTNIVAYLPFLLLSGDTGRFLYSMPVVLTCSLVSSRLVSMTFIPLLGYYLLRAPRKPA